MRWVSIPLRGIPSFKRLKRGGSPLHQDGMGFNPLTRNTFFQTNDWTWKQGVREEGFNPLTRNTFFQTYNSAQYNKVVYKFQSPYEEYLLSNHKGAGNACYRRYMWVSIPLRGIPSFKPTSLEEIWKQSLRVSIPLRGIPSFKLTCQKADNQYRSLFQSPYEEYLLSNR